MFKIGEDLFYFYFREHLQREPSGDFSVPPAKLLTEVLNKSIIYHYQIIIKFHCTVLHVTLNIKKRKCDSTN